MIIHVPLLVLPEMSSEKDSDDSIKHLLKLNPSMTNMLSFILL